MAEALYARGYQVHRNVETSGIFIDIAVTDPDHPERYLLAVKCDHGGAIEVLSEKEYGDAYVRALDEFLAGNPITAKG